MNPPIKPTTPPMGDPPTAFPRSDARRVAESTRYTERQYRNGPVRASREPRGDGGSDGMLAVLSGTLSAASSATAPTSATAVFRKFASGTLSADTPSVTVWNYHNKTFASGALVFVGYALGAWWVIDARDCPT